MDKVWAEHFRNPGQKKATCPVGGNLTEEVSDELHL